MPLIPDWCKTIEADFTEMLLSSLQVQVRSAMWGGVGCVWYIAHPHLLPGTWLGMCGYCRTPIRAASSWLGCCSALPYFQEQGKSMAGWEPSQPSILSRAQPRLGATSTLSGHMARSNQATKWLQLYSQVYYCFICSLPELLCADCCRVVISVLQMVQVSEISFPSVECPWFTQPHGLV